MKKLYYTDPLKAAYMARDFGVKLIDENGDDIWFEHIGTSFGYSLGAAKINFTSKPNNERASFLHPEITFRSVNKAYIHPDSYGIFEPQVGDMVSIGGEEPFIVDIEFSEDFKKYHFVGEYDNRLSGTGKIIQRGGKAFFIPEVEDE